MKPNWNKTIQGMFYALICCCCIMVFVTSDLEAYTLFSNEFGKSGYDLELDPYYTSFEFYTSMFRRMQAMS